MIKKLISILLSISLVALLFCGCAKTETKTKTENKTKEVNDIEAKYLQTLSESDEQSFTFGMLSCAAVTEQEENNKLKQFGLGLNAKFFDNLNSMMLALKSNQIESIVLLPKSTALYIKERNNDLVIDNDIIVNKLKYCMAILENNKEVYNIINDTLKGIIADDTIKDIEKKYIDEFIENNDNPNIDIPHFDGAKVIKVAVTGDLPPFDFVSSKGDPIGYNVALLSEIAKRAKINIELVAVDETAKVTALTTGNVDVLFWLTGYSPDNKPALYDCPNGVILTDCYYEDDSYDIYPKGGRVSKLYDKTSN